MPRPRPLASLHRSVAFVLLALVAAAGARAGGDPNACDAPGDAPNVIVGDLYEIERWGHARDITAFSVGTYSCNVGTCWLNWIAGPGQNQHPTIGQNMFRLKDGRFEQVGQSWLKHGFFALSEEVCTTGCLQTDGEHLGVNCADPYAARLNGTQTRLGPKFEVNAITGFHPHPVTDQGVTGDEVFKRLQVHDADLDPALNPGALYFVEGQYVAEDDAAAGNQHDNASYRQVEVKMQGPEFHLDFLGETQRTQPAILAWPANDTGVQVVTVDDPDGGRFYVAAKATDLGGGTWHYEYAVQNLDSHRSADWFTVPTGDGLTLTRVGFHDVDYHSGEPFDLRDWGQSIANGAIYWFTDDYVANRNANALRWGTLYNFRFDANRPPATTLVTLGLFRPSGSGETDRLVAAVIGPDPCNGDGTCDPGENCVACPNECTDGSPDSDGDGAGYCVDCDDNNPTRWAAPGEVEGLMLSRLTPAGEVSLAWGPAADPGGAPARYEVLRSGVAADFASTLTCVPLPNPVLRTAVDNEADTAGSPLFFLVRALSTCAAGTGTAGWTSLGAPRLVAACP